MKMRLAIVVLLVAPALVVGSAPIEAATAHEKQAAKALLKKINGQRAKLAGLGPLARHAVMDSEAFDHSKYMKNQGAISHDGFCDDMSGSICGTSDGIPTNSRVDRIWGADTGIGQICENVAYASGYATPQAAARVLYRLWKNSPPHYDCMFDEAGFSGDRVGIGVKKKGSSTWYATFLNAEDSSLGDH